MPAMTESRLLDNETDCLSFSFKLLLDSFRESAFRLDIDVRCPAQGVTAIFGASGSGKTSLLRCIAGLLKPDSGKLIFRGETWYDSQFFLPAHKRPLAYVFQEASLFPHLSVQGNLDYARRRAQSAIGGDYDRRVLQLMDIEKLLKRAPHQLSGGERQRVAIARALMIRPGLLLMDEPLASLDAVLKREILPYLEALHKEWSLPVLYVTHAMDEVTRLADYLVIMDHGQSVQQGPVQQVLARTDLPVQLGDESSVVLSGRVAERDARWGLVRVELASCSLWLADAGDALDSQVRLRIMARDVSVTLEEGKQSSILNRLPCRVAAVADSDNEAMALVSLQLSDCASNDSLLARVSKKSVYELELAEGRKCWSQIKSVAVLR